MSKRFLQKPLVLAGLAVLAACATFAAKRGLANDEDVIRMPHAIHQENEVECRACHAAIYKSENLDTRVLPKEKTCLKCHSEWKENNECAKCHVPKEPTTWPARQRTVNFNHVNHLELVDEDCSRCHKALPQPGSTERFTPPMSVCLSCHNHQRDYNNGRCMPCHVDLKRVPLRPVAYFSHQGNFLLEHRTAARSAPEACAQCHDQSFCADCHAQTVAVPPIYKYPERVDRQFIHRDDYISRHAIEARAEPAMCRRCHGTSFCETCHAQNQVLAQPGAVTRNPHPPGYTSGARHGPDARREITNCASCHDRGASTNCVLCHQSGGIGGNPHPESFLDKHRPHPEDIRKNKMCLYCHH